MLNQPKKVFSKFVTGVCILMYRNRESNEYYGLTINSYSSLSLEPLLVNFSLKTNSVYYKNFSNHEVFSINIIDENQVSLAKRCSVSGGGLISKHEVCENEQMYIKGCLASMLCKKQNIHESGDHQLITSHVLDMCYSNTKSPLIFYNSRYHKLFEVSEVMQ